MKELLQLVPIIFLYSLAQILTWFQMNAQFKWVWLQNNHFLLSLCGIPIAYIFLKATKLCYDIYGNAWSGRFIGFSVGILIFGLLTAIILKEGFTLKIVLSILLSLGIIVIQTKL